MDIRFARLTWFATIPAASAISGENHFSHFAPMLTTRTDGLKGHSAVSRHVADGANR